MTVLSSIIWELGKFQRAFGTSAEMFIQYTLQDQIQLVSIPEEG